MTRRLGAWRSCAQVSSSSRRFIARHAVTLIAIDIVTCFASGDDPSIRGEQMNLARDRGDATRGSVTRESHGGEKYICAQLKGR